MTVTLDDIKAAADRIAGQVEHTPCIRSRTLSQITGAEVWVKFENLQFTGSFKERGALNKLLQLTEDERRRGVICASAGNHAQALAYHAARLGIPAVIVMPKPTPQVKVEQTRSHGAEVILEGEVFDDAYACCLRIQAERGLVLVHAFDDDDVMTGQGTAALEMLADAPDLDVLIVPIGGGGLIAGMATAAKALKPGIEVIGVVAAMYPSFTAKKRGERAVCGGATIAEGIAVKAVGEKPFAQALPLIDDILLCEEWAFEQAVALYCLIEKTTAEGAGAGGLAAMLAYPERFRGRKVGLILCGGNIDARLLASVLNRELVREKRIITLRVAGDDRPGMLATLTRVIGEQGGNIIDVAHNRMALHVPAKGAEFEVMLETRGEAHGREIMDALSERGYPPKAV
ncbi:MAG: threonine ammonia-lyase [Pseudomonadota bacterium]|nr:threonine ammonia-lyase [Pseudomonadota bacterium]